MRELSTAKSVCIGIFIIFQLTAHLAYSCSSGISFCIADLKFDGKNLKICELGQGVFSTFRGYDALYGCGKMWAHVWEYMSTFKKPIWFVSPRLNDKNINDIAVEDLQKIGGCAFQSLLELKRDTKFKEIAEQKIDKVDTTKISNFGGIVFIRKKIACLQRFIKKYPHILVVDEKSSWFVGNKYLIYLLFQDDDHLIPYRPRCVVCSKYFQPYKINQMVCKLACDYCVIKPIDASMGRGIVMIEHKKLKNLLKNIFKKDIVNIGEQDSALDYWQHDKNDIFLVEEFVSSKYICVDGKWYDPTMRVAFIVTVEDGNMKITFLDAYWKLPSKALTEDGSLTEIHKSHIIKGGKSACAVDPDDFKRVSAMLNNVLLKLFNKMYMIDVTSLVGNKKRIGVH